uniref:Uncharacterized protein n=1 Tax=Canis lupus familiaris TaxID=9615 RepID=A0A8C0LYG2_CANLF
MSLTHELDKVVIEGNASPGVEGGGVSVTVEVRGDNLVLSVVQDALEGALQCLLYLFLMSSYLTAFSRQQVRSTTDMLGVGTWKAMPVSFWFSSGMTLPTALVAPVETGMMFWAAPWLPCHSFPEGPSMVFWVAVMAWMVVMRPSTMPKWSWMTLARGAKQLVVEEALLTILRELSYFSWFTPITNMGASAEGDGLPIDDKFPVLSLDCRGICGG